jgi:hypothetical protein
MTALNFFLVTFALRNPYKDYSQFLVALRGNSIQWWHYIPQTCVVTTLHDVQGLSDCLRPHLESTDSLLIVRVTPHDMQGWLPKESWDWLNQVSEQIDPTKQALAPLASLMFPPFKLK